MAKLKLSDFPQNVQDRVWDEAQAAGVAAGNAAVEKLPMVPESCSGTSIADDVYRLAHDSARDAYVASFVMRYE